MTKRAATYLRVSRSDQSSTLQADATSSLISGHSWTPSEQFVDDGASGATSKRPGFQAMREAAKQRRFDVLVVYRSDRLFRSVSEFLSTIAELAAHGVAFVSCTEPFDTTTPQGRFMLTILGAVAELERDILCERTRDGLAAARRRGVRLGRPRRMVDVARAIALKRAGHSSEAIARELGVSLRTLARAAAAAAKNGYESPDPTM